MALLFCDGFDDGPITNKWTGTGLTTVAGRHGNAGQVAGGASPNMFRVVAPSAATIILGFALRVSGGDLPLVSLRSDGVVTDHLTITVTVGGTLDLRRGGTGGTVVASSSAPITVNAWHYIEIKATIADAGGTCEVRIDGVTRLSYTGDTRNGGTSTLIDGVYFPNGSGFQTNTRAIDDLYICDGLGSMNNNFLGDIKIETLYPNADGTNSQLMGSDANQVNNYLLVDEAGTPSTADYVSSGVVTDKDTYNFTSLVTATGPVKAVQINNYANKTDAGSRSIKALAISGASTATGAVKPLQTTYNAHLQIQETDPNGGGAWTIAAVNAAEFGVEVDA